MTGRRFISDLLSFVSSLVLMVLILLTAIELNAFNLKFFEKEYRKLNIPQVIGISQPELMDVTVELLAYIKAERDDLKITATIKGVERQVFNQREIDHMVDVQKLYVTAHSLRNTGLAVLFILLLMLRLLAGKSYYRAWAKGYLWGAGCALAFISVIFIMILRDFFWFWTVFHELIFTNDLWLLDPATDILIQMVPEQFFLNLVVRILIHTMIPLQVLVLIAVGIQMKTKGRFY